MIYYFITCFQCALQVTMTFQKLIHFTDWVVGHAHLVMFGVFSQWIFGFMTYLCHVCLGGPGTAGSSVSGTSGCPPWASSSCSSTLAWLACFKGFYWAAMQPWEAMLNNAQPFWITRRLRRIDDVRRFPVFCLELS